MVEESLMVGSVVVGRGLIEVGEETELASDEELVTLLDSDEELVTEERSLVGLGRGSAVVVVVVLSALGVGLAATPPAG